MGSINVIIFGATGGVGSEAALAAKSHGANVFLAMRDTSKPFPNLTSDQEKEVGFTRVQADLLQPNTLQAAVTKTGSKHAFIYLAWASDDHMKAAAKALKSAGIDFIVFLSSGGIKGEAKDALPVNIAAYAHGQVEVTLNDTFGSEGFVAVRANYFASNARRWKPMFVSGDMKIVYPDVTFDWLSPRDVGRVCGALVAGGWSAAQGHNVVPLSGPNVISQRDAALVVAKSLGKSVTVTEIDEDTAVAAMTDAGAPVHLARGLMKIFKDRMESQKNDTTYAGPAYELSVENILKYGGKKATTFEEWIAEDKKAWV